MRDVLLEVNRTLRARPFPVLVSMLATVFAFFDPGASLLVAAASPLALRLLLLGVLGGSLEAVALEAEEAKAEVFLGGMLLA